MSTSNVARLLLCVLPLIALNYSQSLSDCSFTLTEPNGTIQSPNYPANVETAINCSWTVRVNESGVIGFSLAELRLTFGPDPSRQSCDEDALEVYDGDSPKAPLLARYCGTYRRASTIRSSGNIMYFVLRTAAGGPSFKRFTGEYSTSDYHVSRQTLTAPYGIIASPGYPGNDSQNVFSSWTITGPLGTRVNFTMLDVDLGGNETDYLAFFAGSHPGAIRIGQYHGRYMPREISSILSNSLHIIYNSLATTTKKGFVGVYLIDDKEQPHSGSN
ncbi:hypothetical protein BsWGS_25577 [Bradybaena similaris]